jgi:hypothetical protein
MNGKTNTLLALAGVVLLASGAVAGQAKAKPATTPAVAPAAAVQSAPPARLVPPVRGTAELGYTKPVTKNDGKFLITTMKIKNLASGSIAGLKIDYILYDKGSNPVTGDTFRSRKPVQPGEVIDVVLKAPVNKAAVRDAFNFTHANGEIKPKLMAKF